MNEHCANINEVYSDALNLQRMERPDEAAELFLEVLRLQPDHADALHCLGVIDARRGRLEDAERLLRKAVALKPLRANFANSLANLLKAQGRLDEAASMYRQAIHLQPDFANAHNNLGELRLRQGRPQEAAAACYKALELNPEFASAYNNLGRAMNNLGRLSEAAAAFRRAVLIRPNFALAYNHLGHVLRANNELDEAVDVFQHATRLDPFLAEAHFNLGVTLAEVGRVEEGIASMERARDLRPQDIPTMLNLGIAYHTIGRYKLAAQAYRRLIAIDPGSVDAYLNLGLMLHEQRRDDAAESALREALHIAPERTDIYAELAALYEERNRLEDQAEALRAGLALAPNDPRLNVEAAKADRRTGRLREGIVRLQSFDLENLDPRTAEQMHFELGYLHDRAGDADVAFSHFVKANELASKSFRARRAQPQRYLRLVDDLIAYFASVDLTARGTGVMADCESPVFLIGFPRSGTTLMDVVLDGHPKIVTLEEKNTLLPVIESLQRSPEGYPRALSKLTDAEVRQLRKLYFGRIYEFAGDARDRLVVDKLPLNTVHAGLIWRLFPNAKFVFSLRHPFDVVLSCFMQRFAMNDAMANFLSLAGAAEFYDKVMSLWRLYLERLPLLVHTIRYEEVVDNLEGATRDVLDFLGVTWDSAVLDYERRARARSDLNTTSYHQVTQSVYTHARGRWRVYGEYLEPVSKRLSDHAEYFNYER